MVEVPILTEYGYRIKIRGFEITIFYAKNGVHTLRVIEGILEKVK